MITKKRYFDLDWLRVLAFFLLILFHVGMVFNTWGWHIKNEQQSEVLSAIMFFTAQWRIPLLFLISGAGIWYGLMSRGAKGFALERLKRLVLPFIVGVLFVVPPQIYFERLTQGQTYSYFEFYPQFFQGVYPEGNFSWHHLWFIAYMVVALILLMPLLVWLQNKIKMQQLNSFRRNTSSLFGLHWLIVPVLLVDIFLSPIFPYAAQSLVGDWSRFISMALLLLIGFIVCSDQNYWRTFLNYRRHHLIAGLALFFVRYLAYFGVINLESSEWIGSLYAPVRVLSSWYIMLALMGYARKYLSFSSRFLEYTNQAVYPFYILHQTITIIAAYYLVPLPIHWSIKFAMVALFTAVGTWAIYHYLIRPFNSIRVLFGVKVASDKTPTENSIDQLQPDRL